MYGYIYQIENLINHKLYIGYTTLTPEKRWKSHISVAYSPNSKDYNALFKKAIRKYGVESFKISILEEGITTIEELKQKEIEWINRKNSYAFSKNGWGYNSTLGGDGVTDFNNVSVTQFDIVSGKKIANFCSISEAEKHIGVRIEGIGRQNQTSGGYCFLYTKDIQNLSEEQCIEKVHSLYDYLVYQLDENGNILNIFRNTTEASNSVGKDNAGNLISCCLGKRRLCKGFQWAYQKDIKDKIGKPPRKVKDRSIAVRQYGLNGKYIKTFNSIQDAAKALNIGDSHISQCCKGKRQVCGGFQWRLDSENIIELPPITVKRPVICIETKEIFDTCSQAAKHFGYAPQTVKKKLSWK